MSYKIPHLVFVQTTIGPGTAFFPVAHTFTGFTFISTEGAAQVRMSHAGKWSNLKIYINNTGLGGRTLTLRVNGASTALSLTTLNTIGISENTTDEVYVQAGDLVNLQLTGLGVTTNRVISISIDFEADGDRSILYLANMRRSTLSHTFNQLFEICGDLDNFSTPAETIVQSSLRHKCRLVNFHVNTELNTRTGSSTVVFRQNSVDAATVTVPASTTGRINLDTSVSLEVDDLLNVNINLAGTGSIRFFMIQYTLESDNPRELTIFGGRPGSQTATRSVAFAPGVSNAQANRSYVVHITKPMTVDRFKFRLSSNTQPNFSVLVRTSSNNNVFAFTELTCFTTTVPASTTGWFENNTDSFLLSNNRFIYAQFNFISGSYGLDSMSARLTLPEELKIYQTVNHATQ